MGRKFNSIPLRDISVICHPNKITLEEFHETMISFILSTDFSWPKYVGEKKAYIEEYLEHMLAYNEVEQDQSYTR